MLYLKNFKLTEANRHNKELYKKYLKEDVEKLVDLDFTNSPEINRVLDN